MLALEYVFPQGRVCFWAEEARTSWVISCRFANLTLCPRSSFHVVLLHHALARQVLFGHWGGCWDSQSGYLKISDMGTRQEGAGWPYKTENRETILYNTVRVLERKPCPCPKAARQVLQAHSQEGCLISAPCLQSQFVRTNTELFSKFSPN